MSELDYEKNSESQIVKLKYSNVLDFYADMRTLDRVGKSYAIQIKGIKLLKQYMFKDNYGLFVANKPLIGIKGKEVFISEPIGDNSKKRQFIEKWIKEVKSKNNLEGEFSIQDFEKTVNKGEILVKCI
ncbi:hypothetical protein AAW50_00660 [Mycoplasmopsis canis]|uniref:hypothetical protein n=1 Tax=Mycoplasmopsis canis TaxID=29555 RepID=UPI000624D725|nr:hypothetical protein [Mycoplasmopsis canis]AKF40958.1 hypothetical protein AAW50_00660 [Mycoplasmopsis canis]